MTEQHTHTNENGKCTGCGLGVLLLDELQKADSPLYLEAEKIFSDPKGGAKGTTDVAILLLGLAHSIASQGDLFRMMGQPDCDNLWEASDMLVLLANELEARPDLRKFLTETFETSIRGKYLDTTRETNEDSTPAVHLSLVQDSDGSDDGSGFYL